MSILCLFSTLELLKLTAENLCVLFSGKSLHMRVFILKIGSKLTDDSRGSSGCIVFWWSWGNLHLRVNFINYCFSFYLCNFYLLALLLCFWLYKLSLAWSFVYTEILLETVTEIRLHVWKIWQVEKFLNQLLMSSNNFHIQFN